MKLPTSLLSISDEKLSSLAEDLILSGPSEELRELLAEFFPVQEIEMTSAPYLRCDAEWVMDKAASRAVAILLSLTGDGAKNNRERRRALMFALLDHAEYLYCYCSGSGLDIAGAALALIGVCLKDLPEAADWRMAGFSRLATATSKGVQSQLVGALLRAAVETAVQNSVPVLEPAVRLYASLPKTAGARPDIEHFQLTDKQFFDNINLDFPGLEQVRDAVHCEDYERARREYTDYLVDALTVLKEVAATDRFHGYYRPEEADEICQNIFTLRTHMHLKHDFGERVDWTTVLLGDIESNVALNGHAHIAQLAARSGVQPPNNIAATGDGKYAHHAVRLLKSWFEQSPAPDVRKSLQWRTLEVGGRSILRWPNIIGHLIKDEEFQQGALFDMAKWYMMSAMYLATHQAGGGNWFQVETCGMGAASVLFPEFKQSTRWLQLTLRRLAWINSRTFLPDGFQSECSTGYHYLPYITIISFYGLARLRGTELPDELGEDIQKWTDVQLYIAMPDRHMPVLNDWNPSPVDVRVPLRIAMSLFDRDDYRYFATDGAEGQAPQETSYIFPHAGYYIMRSGWDADAQYLLFDAGYYGAGHQHEDKLNFVLHAYGRTLIIDPGIYQYKIDEFAPYFSGGRGHNTIIIDNKEQARRLRKSPEPMPAPDTRWVKRDEYIFAEGWYRDGFALRIMKSRTGADPATLDTCRGRPVCLPAHKRSIFWTKRFGFYVLHDQITGSDDKQHTIEQIFHFAPIEEKRGQPDGYRPGAVVIDNRLVARSMEPQLANIAIIPAEPDGLTARDECGKAEPPVAGWTALYGKQPSHDVTYTKRGTLPVILNVVLFPTPPGKAEIPNVTAIDIQTDGTLASGFIVEFDGRRHIFLISDDGPQRMRAAGVEYTAEFAHIVMDASGVPVAADVVGGGEPLY